MSTPNPTPTQQGETLERCDFCADGGNPQVCQTQKYIHPGGVETDHPLYAVICQDCDARGPEENTPAKAAQRWSTRRAAVAGPRGDAVLPEWTECQSMFADGTTTALSEFIRAYEPIQSTNPDDKAADEWRQALTAVLSAAASADNDANNCTCDDLTEVQRAQGDHYDDCPRAGKGDRTSATPSNRARRAAMELSANGYIDRDLLGEVSEQPVDNDAEAQRLLTECAVATGDRNYQSSPCCSATPFSN